MFGQVKLLARATFVVVAGACVHAIGLADAATAAAVSPQTLVGTWVGPAMGDTGECGTAAGVYAFGPDGTYRYQAMYGTCDAVMIDGHYELQADGSVLQISMELCGEPGCPPDPSIQTTSISAVDPDSIVLDGRYVYHRQRADSV
jgi:hypothetical protein